MMKYLATIAVVLAAVGASFPQARTTAPKGASVTFVSGSTSDVPFRTFNNLIFVQASINGSAPASFIFDTGAESTVIDADLAKSLSLKRSGTTVGSGSAGTATAGVIKGAALELGNVKATDLTLYSLSLANFPPDFGIKTYGIIGNDVIGRVVVDIDYAAGMLHLYSHEAFTPPADADEVPITIEGNLPFIRTEIAPTGRTRVAAKLELDTGSTGSILFNSPFVI